MSRKEFLDTLSARLTQTLSPEEVAEQVRYYDTYISEKVNNGNTEEEVIARLGDPLLIARTIMDTRGGTNGNEVVYEEPADGGSDRSGYGEDGWTQSEKELQEAQNRIRGGCLLAAVIVVVVVVLVLWLVGSVVSFLLPVLIPVLVIMLIVAYFNQRR
jgi:uncharacterized membrane protein